MTRRSALTLTALFLGAALAFAATTGSAQSAGLTQSLRGPTALDETGHAPDLERPATGKRFDKAYRQQPPLIPHKIDSYQIDLQANQCLRCHDWPYNTREGAPKISETHYVGRNGVALDQVTRSRWFCNQCHVPQTDAPSLVRNTFKPAVGAP